MSAWYALFLLQMNYNNKATLVGAMLVAGYDKTNGGQVGSHQTVTARTLPFGPAAHVSHQRGLPTAEAAHIACQGRLAPQLCQDTARMQ